MDIEQREVLYEDGFNVIEIAGDCWIVPRAHAHLILWEMGTANVFFKVKSWDMVCVPPIIVQLRKFESDDLQMLKLEALINRLDVAPMWPFEVHHLMCVKGANVMTVHRHLVAMKSLG